MHDTNSKPDEGFTLADLDAAIDLSRSAVERERRMVEALPQCRTREERQRHLGDLRENLRRLVGLRAALKVRRRLGLRLH